MANTPPSALITDQGRRVLLRLEGHFYELSQEALRELLGTAEGPPGLGITIDHNRMSFEFGGDDHLIEMTAAQLHRRLAKRTIAKV